MRVSARGGVIMITGFIIWSLVSVILSSIGISAWISKKPVGFFTGVKSPEVKNTEKYNHSVAALWFAYAILIEICGIPLLFLEQNSAGFVPVIFGVVAITIAVCIVYLRIEKKYRLPDGGKNCEKT